MEAEIDRRDWPVGLVALATALSGVPAVLLFALVYGPGFDTDPNEMAQAGAMLALAGLGPSCFIGVPLALIFLRDADTPVLAWALSGMATGVIGVVAVGFWIFGISFPMMLFTFLGGMIVLICVAGAVIGAVSGLIARGLLALFLGIAEGRR